MRKNMLVKCQSVQARKSYLHEHLLTRTTTTAEGTMQKQHMK